MLNELENHYQQHEEKLAHYQHLEQNYYTQPETLDYQNQLVYLTLRAGISYEQQWFEWYKEAKAIIVAEQVKNGPK